MTIGERVAELRRDAKKNQKEFAKSLLTSQSHISGIERGEKNLTEKMIRFICVEYSVNEDWLRSGIGNKYNTAWNDIVELEDSARGMKPTNPKGQQMADAIQLAARLNEIYPNICLSCESIDHFLELFKYPEFTNVFNIMVSTLNKAAEENGASFKALSRLVSYVFPDNMSKEEKEKLIKNRIAQQQKEPLSDYLHALYIEFVRDGIFHS